jgi:hypothetical protein
MNQNEDEEQIAADKMEIDQQAENTEAATHVELFI